MEPHFDLSDDQFEAQFRSLTFVPAHFSHEAHLRLAWIHIRKYGVDKAAENIAEQILAFANSLGESAIYNKTLTVAAVKAVNHFYLRSKTGNFKEFIDEFPQLKHEFKQLIGSHYSLDIFNSEEAKAEYLQPDLIPFD
ncbi:MAG: hypothetical protein COW03_13155 [Cytophagales bacterium CG12_big_fil_rev_8_21_14_0_65_40_12]|nr:MAG: hypothetical protein COW03_13155 [Cytophagales bacterium CG12_big_fil_rev_8_21_14_0_65_40_12]PIW03086.1 MAG: hypothetical protein COW40_17230 [Cytophagales bacterium CG17_big_fil_post_rev_8_21_14_2_50_40_13]